MAASKSVARWAPLVSLLAVVTGLLYAPLMQRLTVLGLFRPQHGIEAMRGHDFRVLPDSMQCEDLHHHRESDKIFAVCQDGDAALRTKWFPPLAIFDEPQTRQRAAFAVVDVKTLKVTRITPTGFNGSLVTHGMDILTSPTSPDTILLAVISHPPNPLHYATPSQSPDRASSRVEIFSHELGSTTAKHVRTVLHPGIRTPNDLLFTSPSSFYITNDHRHREGLMRKLEDYTTRSITPWSDIVHISLSKLAGAAPEEGIQLTTALTGLHYNNGLGHVHHARPSELCITDASAGILYHAEHAVQSGDAAITLVDEFQLDSTIDNPSYYVDPYASPAHNASGYIIAGLARAISVHEDTRNKSAPVPGLVWHVTPPNGQQDLPLSKWNSKLIFIDQGYDLRSATVAVLAGIDPAKNGGQKQGWLFVSGMLSEGIAAARIDL